MRDRFLAAQRSDQMQGLKQRSSNNRQMDGGRCLHASWATMLRSASSPISSRAGCVYGYCVAAAPAAGGLAPHCEPSRRADTAPMRMRIGARLLRLSSSSKLHRCRQLASMTRTAGGMDPGQARVQQRGCYNLGLGSEVVWGTGVVAHPAACSLVQKHTKHMVCYLG